MDIWRLSRSRVGLGVRTFPRSVRFIAVAGTTNSQSNGTRVFRTVKEQSTPLQGKVKGVIPPWLTGRLLRNGPGQYEVGDTKYLHAFDGLALLHSFSIKNGNVTYQSRFLRSDTYKKNMAANRIVVSELGTAAYPDPCHNIFQRFLSQFTLTDNCLVNIYPIGEDYVASTESDSLHKIDKDTLESKEKLKLSKYVAVNIATAHPHVDKDGTVYNIGSSFKARPHYNIIKIPIPKDGEPSLSKAKVLCSIPSRWMLTPGYSHSFGMTDNYLVFLEQPFCFNAPKFLSRSITGTNCKVSELFKFRKDEKVRFYVVEKSTGKVLQTKYTADPFFTFHHVNAFEECGQIVLDLSCTKNGQKLLDSFLFENLEKCGLHKLDEHVKYSCRRYVLPLLGLESNATTRDHTAAAQSEQKNLVTLGNSQAQAVLLEDGSVHCEHELISPIPFEFPQINYQEFKGKKYNFAYGVSIDLMQLVKVDVAEKTVKTWKSDGYTPSEPVFVPSPETKSEDDGVVLSSMISVEPGALPPYLVVLDAKTWNEVGRAEFDCSDMHKDLHGLFVPY